MESWYGRMGVGRYPLPAILRSSPASYPVTPASSWFGKIVRRSMRNGLIRLEAIYGRLTVCGWGERAKIWREQELCGIIKGASS